MGRLWNIRAKIADLPGPGACFYRCVGGNIGVHALCIIEYMSADETTQPYIRSNDSVITR